MRCHDVDYKILGGSIQVVEVELDPGETVIAEAGAMNYIEQGIEFETRMGDGSSADQGMFGKLFSAGKRMLSGESLFMTHFTHKGDGKATVAFAAPYPGEVVAIDMAQHAEQLFCQKDAFLCAAAGTELDIAFSKKIGSGLFGGEGFILQHLKGDGLAFLQAGGTLVKKELSNETLRVDTGCLVAFTEGVDYDITMVKSLKSMVFGGEGVWLTTLSGTGTVWLQSLPFSRLADRIVAASPALGGQNVGES